MTRTISKAELVSAVHASDVFCPRDRSEHLLASSMLTGGTLRSLAAAAGMMTVLGVSPAFAQCFSGAGSALTTGVGNCEHTAATGGNSTAVGTFSNATGLNATAYGNFAVANGAATTASGSGATANGASATATGAFANANGDNATATGTGSTANGFAATATGAGSTANGTAATATGVGSTANGGSSTATGVASTANGGFATATGAGSVANGATASAYGQSSNATGDATTAIGRASTASATGATALGFTARATAGGAVAVGQNSTASGVNSGAFGTGATATFANSTAIGNGATTTAANQVAIGTSTNTYRMSGITSAASLAAQSGPTSLVTTDANGNLAAASFSGQDISLLQSNVTTLQTQMRQGFEGTAIAIAMGGSALPSDKKFAISSNWGTFRGENAMSFNAQMRLNQYVVVNGGVGAGFAQGGIGGRAGVTVAW